MEQAPVEQVIIRQCMRERLPFPERIANAPRLQIGLELYYEAFWELGSCRAFGMSLGPIPWTAIQDYARAFELDEKQREDLVYYVRVMDLEYLKFHAPKKPATSVTKGKRWRPQGHSRS